MWNHKQAVIFDMDGVLVDNGAYHSMAWAEFRRRYGIRDSFSHQSMFGKTNRDYLLQFFGALDENELNRLSKEKESIYHAIYREEIKPVTGLETFLEKIHSVGMHIALATSGPAMNVRFVFENLGIGHFFRVCLDDSQVRQGKPHPEIYLKTSEKLDIPPQHCLVIEDSVHGIEAALAAGMKVVGLNTGMDRSRLTKAHLVVDDFTELDVKTVKALLHDRDQ